MTTAKQTFENRKKLILAFAAGLLLGPLVSGLMGWQIRSDTVKNLVRSASVQQQVKFCVDRARAEVTNPDKLGYQERFDLAKKWAMMPWQQDVDSDVLSACSNNLADAA